MELSKHKSHHVWTFHEKIDFYHPDKIITGFFNNNFVPKTAPERGIFSDFIEFSRLKSLEKRYEKFSYCKMFQMMLNIEDLTVQKALNEFSLFNQSIKPIHIDFLQNFKQQYHEQYEINLKGKKLTEKLGFNYLVLTPMSVCAGKSNLNAPQVEKSRIYTTILLIDGSRVVFEGSRNEGRFNLSEKYHVQFVVNRIASRLALRSLGKIQDMNLEAFFTTFNENQLADSQKRNFGDDIDVIECCNPSVSNNEAQLATVQHILNKTSFPSPYVVFGPPGTGKTATIVEAIAQIVKLRLKAKILVTANSNSACDEIGERLLKFIPSYKMYRLYAPSFDNSFQVRRMHLNAAMKPISNIKTGVNVYPSYEEFNSYSVVISTLVNCGRIISAGVLSSHFDYIFIDECASTIEPISIIPIVSFGAAYRRMTAQVVLAGDHKQLQGVVHSDFNEKHGFGVSLMERVMMLEKYKFPYDPKYVTQLTDNYRSHPAILHFSNQQFYRSKLRACQSEGIANFAIGWSLLPNKKFPLIFHSVKGESKVDGTSLFNLKEIEIVEFYVKTLLSNKNVEPKDIGIICHYVAQQKKLKAKFKFTDELEIGTVDAYQGREKLIIIISTVRSQTKTVGFLKNEKRLNVALTRAKALLIVIGNYETLSKDKMWSKFLDYCQKHNAIVGETSELDEEKLLQMIKKM